MKAGSIKDEIVWDWMRPEAVTVSPEETVEAAVKRMQKFDIHSLLVMQADRYLGLMTARDCAGIWNPAKKVSEIMRTDVPLIEETAEVGEAVDLMVKGRYPALPLKSDGRVKSILTSTDLLRLLGHQLDRTPLVNLVEGGEKFLSSPLIQSFLNILSSAGI